MGACIFFFPVVGTQSIQGLIFPSARTILDQANGGGTLKKSGRVHAQMYIQYMPAPTRMRGNDSSEK